MSREVCGICWCPYDDDTGECACEPEPEAKHMTNLRTAAQQALEALESAEVDPHSSDAVYKAITALRAALAEDALQRLTDVSQEIEAALAEPVQEPGDFDHGIGADRFKVVRGAFWWHVLIGDSPTEHGKFRSRASAEKMAADLLREFRNGAFVQHEAALAEPCPCGDRPAAQCPGEWEPGCDLGNNPKYAKRVKMTPKELAASIKRGEKWKVAEPVQEPVYWEVRCTAHPKWMRVDEQQFDEYVANGWEGQRLYAAPPQRKPLSEDEALDIARTFGAQPWPPGSCVAFARAIERAHGVGEQQ